MLTMGQGSWEGEFDHEKKSFSEKHGFVRNAIREDIVQFAIPGITVFFIEILFCAVDGSRNGLSGIWGKLWGLIMHPENLSTFSVQSLIGLALFVIGLTIMIVGQVTLSRNYSGTVVIREGHQLIRHGIYRFTRNPIYLGLIVGVIGLPIYVASLGGFLTSLVLIPIILNRIRLEERLLAEEFQDGFQQYKESTKKLIPFIY